MIDKRQWGPEWDNLHPEQQQFVPRDLFIECSGKDDTPDVESVDVLAVEDDEMLIPGTEVRSASKAVNVKLKLNRGPLNRYEVQDTIQLFDVAGRWRWVLPNIESYKSGNCPD